MALPLTSPFTSLILVAPLLCLHSPGSLTASLTLEIQWDQGLELQGFESPELERSEEKGLEELGVPRWEEIHLHRAL
jgi:hypothetical protein